MKQVTNFRLSTHTLTALYALQRVLHLSKTAIVEKAIKIYAQTELCKKQNHSLLEFAGTLTDKESRKILKTIHEDRHNKMLNIKL